MNIDYDAVSQFFDERGKKEGLAHKYNYVLFQDSNPRLARQRDMQEKEKIRPFLPQNGDAKMRVLDIGCGIGRWGEALLEMGYDYVGIDGSEAMLRIANENLSAYENKKLLAGKVQEFPSVLESAGEDRPFDMVFANGIFMYLNDADFRKALQDIRLSLNDHFLLYFMESMGWMERLTLDRVHSDEMGQTYSAIYRSVNEYRRSFTEAFGKTAYPVADGVLYGKELENQTDTVDYYFVFRR